jgi:hypothetical protein
MVLGLFFYESLLYVLRSVISLTSTSSEAVLSIFIALWQPHHSLPAMGSIRVTGVAAVPTDTVKGSVVFQPPSATRAFILSICTHLRILVITKNTGLRRGATRDKLKGNLKLYKQEIKHIHAMAI